MENTALKYQPLRDIDPNVLQRRASDPAQSVWVNASAGTGKTKVLTDRVLRLLLPRPDGTPGTPAHKILCLTFTKAGASEMALRIADILAQWTAITEKKLAEKLQSLTGKTPSNDEIKAARALFAHVIDTPGGLKIMTIHSFCQSILGRFPLEAGLKPQFTVLEEAEAQKLLESAKRSTLKMLQNDKAHPLNDSLTRLSHVLNEDQLGNILRNVASERHQLETIIKHSFSKDGLYPNLCEHLEVSHTATKHTIIQDLAENTPTSINHAAQDMLQYGTKTQQPRASSMLQWIQSNTQERIETFELYSAAFLTQKGTPHKIGTKDFLTKAAQSVDILEREAERISVACEEIKRFETARYTSDILALCHEIVQQYQAQKALQSGLDFDDLILYTLTLLQKRGSWVHYKLDQGLDHILVDEAQDTNPEQWQIVEALCDDFFAGHSQGDENRTLFVVGDEKQSIYSFQRASPEEFTRMQDDFARKLQNADQSLERIDLNISFRSVPSVLNAVDHVFSQPETYHGVSTNPTEHQSFRRGQAGLTEIWPLSEAQEIPQQSLWEPPVKVYEQENAQQKCAAYIAKKIRNWVDDKTPLESRNKAIEAGDIMILVRTRTAFVDHMVRALKQLDIPVTGADRMVLGNQIAVQDLLSCARFVLQPMDDLNLACLLKSPLIGMDEDTLLELAYERPASLFEQISEGAYADIAAYLDQLRRLIKADNPYAFFTHILQKPCPASAQSGRHAFQKRLGADCLDSIEEFLNAALNYEHQHSTSLQHFVHAQEQSDTHIKREFDEAPNMVRIMTVHGSKGLQSPIVILPDTVASPKNAPTRAENRLLWPNQTGLNIPLWSPNKDTDCAEFIEAMDTIKTRQDQEYRRLLYVAMTRAEDHLYITGYKGKSDPAEHCWYNRIKNGLERAENTISEDENLKLFHVQTAEPDRRSKSAEEHKHHSEPPEWLYKPVKIKDTRFDIVQPSRLAEEEATSPLDNANTKRFLRGNLTHSLLQLLPDIPEAQRAAKAQSFLSHYASQLTAEQQDSITAETLNILNDPQFAAIFGPGSMAEVPVTGVLKEQNQIINGQIDRLLVTDDEILIIDYKTNRPPPLDPKDVPHIYYDQLASYAALIQKIYPGRNVRTALLWTDGPRLMPLDLESR